MIGEGREPETFDALEQQLVEALREDYLADCRDAPIPSAGLVWWRASLRARADAAHKAERPITVGHGIIGATVAGATVAAAGAVWRFVPSFPEPSLAVVATLAIAVGVVIAPLALVLTLARDN